MTAESLAGTGQRAATESLADWARHQPAQALTIMVGPEGGFSDEEEAEALRNGALHALFGRAQSRFLDRDLVATGSHTGKGVITLSR